MTPSEDLTHALRSYPHFRALQARALAEISRATTVRSLAAGETVMREGEPSRAFFAVRSGAVRIFRASPDGRRQVLHTLRAGQVFAEAAVLHIGRYPASAEALETPTELLEIDGPTFKTLFREDETVAASMVASLSGWLLRLVERVEELQVASAGARLAHYLLRLPARDEAGVLVVELPLAKKALAEHLAITPETLSRQLRRFADRGLVEVEGRKLKLLDAGTLETLADGDLDPRS